jgi:hypothetical protein
MDRIHALLGRIAALEEELAAALHERESTVHFRIHGRRIEFERSVKLAHRRLKTGVVRWIFTNRPQNLLTAPVIYALGIPLVLLDFCVTAFQALCFPVYGIAKARRSDYIALDRGQLEYLNVFEKFHCDYCGYANGLIAYAAEIAARTEQYFCPIKHAHKVLGSHARHARFLAYGAAAGYPAKLEAFRAGLAKERMRCKD